MKKPGNPRFLVQPIQKKPCFRRIMRDLWKTLKSSDVDNSMTKKKKTLNRFSFPVEEIQTVSRGSNKVQYFHYRYLILFC